MSTENVTTAAEGQDSDQQYLTRRNVIQISIATLTVGSQATIVSADDDSGLTAVSTAASNTNGTPDYLRISDRTSIELTWGQMPEGETVTVEFDIRPTETENGWETIGDYEFVPDEPSGGQKTITADDLFESDGGDITDHPEISLEDFRIEPAVGPTCKAKQFEAKATVETESIGTVGVISDDFQVLFVLETGLGYNLGSNLGLKYPDFSRESSYEFDGNDEDFVIDASGYEDGVSQLEDLLADEE